MYCTSDKSCIELFWNGLEEAIDVTSSRLSSMNWASENWQRFQLYPLKVDMTDLTNETRRYTLCRVRYTVNLPYKVSGYRESRLIRSDFLGFATAFC